MFSRVLVCAAFFSASLASATVLSFDRVEQPTGSIFGGTEPAVKISYSSAEVGRFTRRQVDELLKKEVYPALIGPGTSWVMNICALTATSIYAWKNRLFTTMTLSPTGEPWETVSESVIGVNKENVPGALCGLVGVFFTQVIRTGVNLVYGEFKGPIKLDIYQRSLLEGGATCALAEGQFFVEDISKDRVIEFEKVLSFLTRN